MAGFEGWWVNSQTGKGHRVSEHWLEVEANPERYGLTEDDLAKMKKEAGGKFNPGDTSPDGARGMLLKAVMKRGWVRVRGYQNQYAIQVYGSLASRLPKVFGFLRKNGVGPYSQIMLNDLATDFSQTYKEGMADIQKDLKAGKIPDTSPAPSPVVAKGLAKIRLKTGIPAGLSDKQSRTLLRQRIGQRLHVPDPTPGDGFLPESRSLRKGLRKLLL